MANWKKTMMASAGGGADYFINTVYREGQRVRPFNVALDGSDNILVSGQYDYDGSGTVTGGMVYKLNGETGDLDWMKYQNYGNQSGGNVAYGCAADSSGNVYVTGYHGQTTYTYLKGCVSKYNSSGALQWVRDYGDESSNNFYIPTYIAVNGSNIVANGYRRYSGLGFYEGFNIGYNSSGTKQFDQAPRLNGWDWYGTGCVFNSSGHWLEMHNGPNSSINDWDVEIRANTFASSPSQQDVVRLSATGTQQRFQQHLGTGRQLAVDSNDDMIFGGEIFVNTNDRAAVIGRYDVSSNSVAWSKKLAVTPDGGTYTYKRSRTFAVAADSSNNIYALIYVYNNDPSSRISYVLLKYNTSGTLQWARELWHDNSTTYGYFQDQASMVIDSQDRIVIMLESYAFVGSSNAYISTVFRLPNDGSLTGSYDCVRPFDYNTVSSSNIDVKSVNFIAGIYSILSYGAIGFSPDSPSETSPDASGVSSTTTVI